MSNKLKYAPSPPPEPIIIDLPISGPKKRGRKRTKKQYFTPDTDAAIKEYLATSNQDDREIFRSDDEVGWFFRELQKIQEALNEFTIK